MVPKYLNLALRRSSVGDGISVKTRMSLSVYGMSPGYIYIYIYIYGMYILTVYSGILSDIPF